MSNDSSYSTSSEDGVDIILVDSSSPDNQKLMLDDAQESSDASSASDLQNDASRVQSFTFEAQVRVLTIYYFIDKACYGFSQS